MEPTQATTPTPRKPRATVPAVAKAPTTPMEMLAHAVTSGASVEVLGQLLALQERYQANAARAEFELAIAQAKAEMPVITKNRRVDYENKRSDGRTSYAYEDLAAVAEAITPVLSKHGLSYRFRTSSTPNEPVTVTCIIAHRDGHHEENTLCAPPDNSGNKNSIQAIGSTVTYLQRMTLKAALGLAAAEDDDGRGAGNGAVVETIDEQQLEALRGRMADRGVAEDRVVAFLSAQSKGRVTKLEDMPKGLLPYITDKVNAAGAKQEGGE